MVKKTISFTLIILLLLLVYQFVVNLAKSSHYITYTITKEDKLFNVDEKYIKEDGKDYYLIKVSDKDNNFIWRLDNTFNKQKNIIEDVKIIEQDGYYCLGLSFVGKKYYAYPECIKDNSLMSYSSVKDKVNLKSFVSKITDKNKEKYSTDSSKRTEELLIVNKDYLDEKEALLIYSYKLMSLHYLNYARNFSFSNSDNYKNEYGALVGKYYVIPRLTSLPTINTFMKYDIVDGIKKEITLPMTISKLSYINGVYDNKLYVFDKSDKRQFEIDPYTDEVTLIGTVDEEGITVINGKKEKISVYDLEKNKVEFSADLTPYSEIDYDQIYVDDDYAVYTKNGDFYKVYNGYENIPIYLFTEPNAHNVRVTNGNVYYVKDNSIYKHNVYGSFVLASRNEFVHNYDNIFDIYVYE